MGITSSAVFIMTIDYDHLSIMIIMFILMESRMTDEQSWSFIRAVGSKKKQERVERVMCHFRAGGGG